MTKLQRAISASGLKNGYDIWVCVKKPIEHSFSVGKITKIQVFKYHNSNILVEILLCKNQVLI